MSTYPCEMIPNTVMASAELHDGAFESEGGGGFLFVLNKLRQKIVRDHRNNMICLIPFQSGFQPRWNDIEPLLLLFVV